MVKTKKTISLLYGFKVQKTQHNSTKTNHKPQSKTVHFLRFCPASHPSFERLNFLQLVQVLIKDNSWNIVIQWLNFLLDISAHHQVFK